MKVTLISGRGEGMGLAFRLKEEGNDVRAWVRAGTHKAVWDGLIPKVTRWEDGLDETSLILFDSTGAGKTADRLRTQGHHVLGASMFSDNVMRDSQLNKELISLAGCGSKGKGVTHFLHGWFDGEKFLDGRPIENDTQEERKSAA